LQNYYRANKLNFEEEIKKTLYRDIVDEANSELVKEIINYCVAPGNSPKNKL